MRHGQTTGHGFRLEHPFTTSFWWHLGGLAVQMLRGLLEVLQK